MVLVFCVKKTVIFNRLDALYPTFLTLNDEQRLSVVLCPSTLEIAKCVSKYLGIMTKTRKEIDLGLNPDNLNLYLKHKA